MTSIISINLTNPEFPEFPKAIFLDCVEKFMEIDFFSERQQGEMEDEERRPGFNQFYNSPSIL